jgi:carbohydrate-selective porin OprB
VRPNLQYINHVGGTNLYADAVVGGMTLKLVV